MKTKEEYENFANELKLLCEKHGIFVVGTCESEGIYGEIALIDKDDPENYWKDPFEKIGFNVYMDRFPRLVNY
jgi:hypothetical protein